MTRPVTRLLIFLFAMSVATLPAAAAGYKTVYWQDLQGQIFGDRPVLPAGGAVTLDAPVRAADDRRVPIGIRARMNDGSLIRSVSLVIDENPMPLAAVFTFDDPRFAVAVGADVRLNGPSPVRAVVETEDGRLYMTETLVKTSGLGACAAPPAGDPDAAIAAIGQMQARMVADDSDTGAPRSVRLDIRHPQHTGLQMDQITLLYILTRYVHTLDVWAAEERLFTLTGSISLSEDPAITFELRDPGTQEIRVRFEDTSDKVIDRVLTLGSQG